MSLRRLLAFTAALASLGLALYSYRYLAGVGPRSPDILANALAKPWLYLHIAGAATALLIAPLQLWPWLRGRHRSLHRRLGRIYMVACLVGGVAGFFVAFGSTAGPIATSGFATLALIWIAVNVQGWRAAVERRFDNHRAWMLRSAALTFAAVTLRLYLGIGVAAGLPFLDVYRATAWVSWISNLILVELYLRGALGGRVAGKAFRQATI